MLDGNLVYQYLCVCSTQCVLNMEMPGTYPNRSRTAEILCTNGQVEDGSSRGWQ